MHLALDRSRECRIFRAGLLYRKGRARVVWVNGVVYFGGSLFLFFNAVDYLVEPYSALTSTALFWLVAALLACLSLGYLYGVATWRNLDRFFGPD